MNLTSEQLLTCLRRAFPFIPSNTQTVYIHISLTSTLGRILRLVVGSPPEESHIFTLELTHAQVQRLDREIENFLAELKRDHVRAMARAIELRDNGTTSPFKNFALCYIDMAESLKEIRKLTLGTSVKNGAEVWKRCDEILAQLRIFEPEGL